MLISIIPPAPSPEAPSGEESPPLEVMLPEPKKFIDISFTEPPEPPPP